MAGHHDMDAIIDAALDELDDDNDSDEGTTRVVPGRGYVVNDAPFPQQYGFEGAKDPAVESATSRDCSPIGGADDPDIIWFQAQLRSFIQADTNNDNPEASLERFMQQVQIRVPDSNTNRKSRRIPTPSRPNPNIPSSDKTNDGARRERRQINWIFWNGCNHKLPSFSMFRYNAFQ